jgi:hypothetical protein
VDFPRCFKAPFASLVDWQADRPQHEATTRIEARWPSFVGALEVGHIPAACALTTPALANHPGFDDCPSLLNSYAYYYPGDLAVAEVWVSRQLAGRVVVRRGTERAFELGMLYDPESNRSVVSRIETLAPPRGRASLRVPDGRRTVRSRRLTPGVTGSPHNPRSSRTADPAWFLGR